MRKKFTSILLAFTPILLVGQFHTMKIPTASAKVTETQRLGITDITVDYHSPAVKGRDVWSDVVRSYDDPDLAWRAGANMNTTIAFTTDVLINGQPLEAGSYGFHVDLSESEPWTLMFAHHDNLWGSYYLDKEEHVALKVKVDPIEAPFSEQLDYRFVNRTDSSLVIALDWAEKRIPFTVSVDLNKTVIENFRYELLGINTYRWEAWNDAANWCLNRNTNLEEALDWANRSIEGGYTGFAASRNFNNLTTKGNILWTLGKESASDEAMNEAIALLDDPGDAYYTGTKLSRDGRHDLAFKLFEKGMEAFPDTWYLSLGYARSLYKGGDQKKGIKMLETSIQITPERNKNYVKSLVEQMKKGESID